MPAGAKSALAGQRRRGSSETFYESGGEIQFLQEFCGWKRAPLSVIKRGMPPLSRFQLPRATLWTLGFALLILLGLQFWRPYFFLTDDNLVGGLPILVDISRRIWSGQSPFVSEYIFGGGYQLLGDTSALPLWNPLNLLASILIKTGGEYAMVDVVCSLNVLLGAGAFSLLLVRVREKYRLESLSDRRLVFLSLSFSFSTFSLLIGPSWMNFLANQAVLPILALGLLDAKRKRGIFLVALGLSHALLAGHSSSLLFALLFFSVLVFGLCRVEKSAEPLLRWVGGGVGALAIASPFLLPAVMGFSGVGRSSPLSIAQMSDTAVPLPLFIASFFVSCFSFLSGFSYQTVGSGHGAYDYAIASCAASFLVFHGLHFKKRPSSWEWLVLSLLLGSILFVVRPQWLSLLLLETPLFRSLRWPFREILLFQFFVHLWIASRPVSLSPRLCRATAIIGIAIFLLPFFLSERPPTLSPMKLDQKLVVSGQSEAFWRQIKSELGPQNRIAGAASPKMLIENLAKFPFSLLGGFNYPALYEVPSVSGYWIMGFKGNAALGERPYEHYGIFAPEVAARLKAKDPHLKVLTLISLEPLKIEISDAKSKKIIQLSPELTQFLERQNRS